MDRRTFEPIDFSNVNFNVLKQISTVSNVYCDSHEKETS